MIERVEGIHTEFQLLALHTGQLDRFLDGHIYGRESGPANCVSGSCTATEGESESSNCGGLTGEILQFSGRVCVNVLLKSGGTHQNGGCVEGERRREGASTDRKWIPSSPGNDAGCTPAAHDRV